MAVQLFRSKVVGVALTTATLSAFAGASTAHATLTPLRPAPTDPITFFGHGGYSSDGAAPNGASVQARVPAGSTVERAYLYGSFQGGGSTLAGEEQVTFNGDAVAFEQISFEEGPFYDNFITGRVDVTSKVAGVVGSGGGTYDFPVEASSYTQHGFGLVVIYSNPNEPEVSVGVLDGFAEMNGDQAKLYLAEPLDLTKPGFRSTLALGIGWSAGTASNIDVNGQRLSSSAGGDDDAPGTALITVGGVGDSAANPADPNSDASSDDELYDLTPFLSQGDTEVTVDTYNASQNDAVFVAVVEIAADAGLGSNGAAPPAPAAPSPTARVSTGRGTARQSVTIAKPYGGRVELLDGATPVSMLTVPGQGVYSIDGEGELSFAPALGFTGTATPATFRVVDRHAQSGTSTYSPTVTAPDAPAPSRLASAGVVGETQSVLVDVPEGGSFALLDENGNEVSSLRIAGQGRYVADALTRRITFEPEGGFVGRPTAISYRVTDAYGQSRAATFAPVVDAKPAAVAATPAAAQPRALVPAATQCVSRRSMTINWRVPSGSRTGKTTIKVDGVVKAVLREGARRYTVSMKGMRKRTVTVVVSTRTARGELLRTERVYRTCEPGRRSKGLATLRLTKKR